MIDKTLWQVGDEEFNCIKKALKAGLRGEYNKQLEHEFAKKFRSKFAISVNSGTSALHSALYACGIKQEDEVIVPPLTFAAPAFAALMLGAVPVFADVDPETFNINPEEIKRKITKRTKAIIPVSLYGLPVEIDTIMDIAKKNNLKVIEDNAECMLGKYKGRVAGQIADISIFSFEKTKFMITGNGGMITTNDEKLAERARKFSILGYTTLSARENSFKKELDKVQHPNFKRHEIVGFNYRLPEICAAMALPQLKKLESLVRMRQKIAKLYENAIKECEWLTPQKTPSGFVHSYWTYVVKLDTNKVSWENFRKVFIELGGERFYGAWSINYLEPVLKGKSFPNHNVKYEAGLCPIAESLQPKLIQLKTNFGNLEYARRQAAILKQTIKTFSI